MCEWEIDGGHCCSGGREQTVYEYTILNIFKELHYN